MHRTAAPASGSGAGIGRAECDLGVEPSVGEISGARLGHVRIPRADLRVGGGQLVFAGGEEVAEHPVEVEVHEARAVAE